MIINLSDFLNKEVTATLRNGVTLTGTLISSLGKFYPGHYEKYPYFLEPDNNGPFTWTNTGRYDILVSEYEYDIISIVETAPKQMNNKQQLLKSIQETENQLNKLKKQLEQQKPPTIQEAKVSDTLEDGSIVIKKENGLALLLAPKSTEVICQWTKQFSEVFDKLLEQGFIPSQWFVPTFEQLKLAYKVIPDEFNKEWYWSSSEYNAPNACSVRFSSSTLYIGNKSIPYYVRSVRYISY
jgi:hypothetical protein